MITLWPAVFDKCSDTFTASRLCQQKLVPLLGLAPQLLHNSLWDAQIVLYALL